MAVTNNEFIASFDQTAVVYLSGVRGLFAYNSLDAAVIYDTALRLDHTAAGLQILSNNINLGTGAASGVGIYVGSDRAVISQNRVFDWGIFEGSAVGIDNVGVTNPGTNTITRNEVRCYGTPFVNAGGNGNVVLPCPWQ